MKQIVNIRVNSAIKVKLTVDSPVELEELQGKINQLSGIVSVNPVKQKKYRRHLTKAHKLAIGRGVAQAKIKRIAKNPLGRPKKNLALLPKRTRGRPRKYPKIWTKTEEKILLKHAKHHRWDIITKIFNITKKQAIDKYYNLVKRR